MKKYLQQIAIVSFLIVAQIGAFALKSHAQVTKDTVLLADETILIEKGNTRIETVNEQIFDKIYNAHKQLITKVSMQWRKNKGRYYSYYTMYISKSDTNIIVNWAKTNL